MNKKIILPVVALLTSLAPAVSYGHATFEAKEAPVNQNYKAVLRIPHGCEGTGTTSITVSLPEGAIRAKPKPKAGWTIELKKGKYEKTYQYHGEVTEGVKSITWKGGLLPNDYYDEFVFRVRITDTFKAGQTIYFPVVQTCEKGSHDWVEIPKEGQDRHSVRHPAPSLKIIENHHHGHSHKHK